MTELDERIRNFIDFNVTPVRVEEVMEIGNNLTRHVAPRSRLRRRKSLVMCGAVAVIVALAIVGLVNIPGPKGTNTPRASAATAKALLDSAATRADDQRALIPGPGEYLYVATISSQTNGESIPPASKTFFYDSDELTETWTSPRAASHQSYRIVGRPIFLSARDRTAWVLDGSKPLGSGNGSGPPPPYYDVTSLPTKPSAMISFFRSQKDIPQRQSYESDATWEFSTALSYLQSGASSAQRAALLRFSASIPGIRLQGHTRSVVTDETGSVISLRIGWGTGRSQEAVFDPSSSTLLETRLVQTSLPANTLPKLPGMPTPFVGEILSYTDFIFAGVTKANSGFTLPAHTPTFPLAWPFTETREPLPGSVQSFSK
jgi:hypothetical protein